MSKLPILGLLLAIPACLWSPVAALGQSGVVKSEGQPLPGATVRATQGDRVLTTVTDPAGAFTIEKMTPGAWTVDVTMFGFDTIRKDVQIGTAPAKIDFNLQLRQFAGPNGRGGGARANAAAAASGAEGLVAQPENEGQNEGQGVADAGGSGAPAGAPPADASGANEAFLVNGSISTGLQTQSGDFGPPGGPGGFGGGLNAGGPPGGFGDGPAANLQAQPAGGVPGGGAVAAPGGGGGFAGGGPPGGFGGRGGGGGGGGRGGAGGRGGRGPSGRGGGAFIGNRRNAGRSQIRGSFFYGLRDSVLDASPFSLNGQTNTKAAYSQNRFGFTVGGPLEIPHLVHWENTTWSINYTGSLLRNGLNLTGTVPTLAERGGDFSALSTIIYDPITGLPFDKNQIPGGRINTIAQGLFAYVPLPNQPGIVNNYRLIASVPNNSQALNTRVSQTLSRRDQIGVVFNWQGRNANNLQLYDFTDQTSGNGINGNISWRHNLGTGKLNNLVMTFNRNTNVATPFFANGTNVAALLGIQGTSSNPINFGPPNLSFTNFSALSDGSPSHSAVYSAGFTDTLAYRKGKHNWSFGAGYTRNFNNTVTDSNGRGTFTFTGLGTSGFDANGNALPGTGLDLADFLLGLPQSNSIRFGSSSTYFRTNSYNAFAQDDWRARANLTLNLGVRYEYFAPWQEKYGRIANLDIAPGFTAVVPVTPTIPGPYSGSFPAGLINPDRNNFAPRAGLAWKPSAKSKITVRMGYGWYYNPGVYNQFMSRLSAQPPFATSTTVNTSLLDPLTLATGLTATSGKAITNTFAVDRDYRDMYAQSWNLAIQSDLPGALVGQLTYLGTKGTRLDVQVSPNQAPPGSQLTAEQRLAIGNATGFVYDLPVGNSIYHALQARLNRRFRRGFSGAIQYTFAKSIDDSSTLGGAGNTVAQNFYDLSAERGLSSFDHRHNVAINYVWSSPVGNNGFLADKGFLTTALEGWTMSGSVTLQTGAPLTARVLGNQSDTAGTGNFGSSRASATGLPIDSGSGFFNLLAFTTPVAGQYGNAGRNTITGPGTFSMNASLQRTIPITERMRMQIQAAANNLTNHVNITSFGTVVNSQTYGVATGAGGMRNLTLTLRFNF